MLGCPYGWPQWSVATRTVIADGKKLRGFGNCGQLNSSFILEWSLLSGENMRDVCIEIFTIFVHFIGSPRTPVEVAIIWIFCAPSYIPYYSPYFVFVLYFRPFCILFSYSFIFLLLLKYFLLHSFLLSSFLSSTLFFHPLQSCNNNRVPYRAITYSNTRVFLYDPSHTAI